MTVDDVEREGVENREMRKAGRGGDIHRWAAHQNRFFFLGNAGTTRGLKSPLEIGLYEASKHTLAHSYRESS